MRKGRAGQNPNIKAALQGVFTVKARANGNRQGGGTNASRAIAKAMEAANNYATVTGGATFVCPPGIYRVDSQIQYYGNIKYQTFGAVFDGTNCTASSLFWAEGTTGSEVNFTTAGARDDETIHAAGHGLVEEDYILPKSSRYCLAHLVDGVVTTDVRPDFCLGETTTSTTSTYGADRPKQVKTVTDADNFTVNVPLEFQDFPITAVGAGTRTCSTVMKINWLRGIVWEGGEFIASSAMGSVMECDWAFEPKFNGLKFTMGSAISRAHTLRTCLGAQRTGCSAYYKPGGATTISQNSFYQTGCWDTLDLLWRVENGWQAHDVTWVQQGHAPINIRIGYGTAINCVNVLTFHPGIDGGEIFQNRGDGCDQGISQRSPRVETHHNFLTHAETDSTTRYGIVLGPYSRGCKTHNNMIEGYYLGIRDQIDGIIGTGPFEKSFEIFQNRIVRAVVQIDIQTATTGGATTLGCGGKIYENEFEYPKDTGVKVGAYRNGLRIYDNTARYATGASFELVDIAADSVDNVVERNRNVYCGAASTVLKSLNITDATTFPVATYPTTRLRQSGNVPIGGGNATFITGDQLVLLNTNYSLQAHDADCNDGMVTVRGITAKTLTLTKQASTPWRPNARLRLMQRDSGRLKLLADTGVTIRNRDGVSTTEIYAVGENSVFFVERTFEDTWVVYGDCVSEWYPSLPSPQIKAAGTIDAATMMSGLDTADCGPRVGQILMSSEIAGRVVRFPGTRAWRFLTRPSAVSGTATNSSSYYYGFPRTFNLEMGTGASFDFTGWGNHGGSAYYFKTTDAAFGTFRFVNTSITKGDRSIVMNAGQVSGLVPGHRMRLKNLTAQDTTVGAISVGWDGPALGITASIASDGVMTVAASDSASHVYVGSHIVASGVDTYVVSRGTGTGGTGTYNVAMTGSTISSRSMLVYSGWTTRGEDVIVKSIDPDGVTIHLYAAVRDNYSTTATPVLQLIGSRPKTVLTNFTAVGIGDDATDNRLFQTAGGEITIVDGFISGFNQAYGVWSSPKMLIEGVTMDCTKDSDAGGGLNIGGTTKGVVRRCTANGGSQPFMLTPKIQFDGITRDVLFDFCISNGSTLAGFSQHSTSSDISYRHCKAFYPGTGVVGEPLGVGFDIRTQRTSLDACEVVGATGAAIAIRWDINGFRCRDARIREGVGGVVLTNNEDETRVWPSLPGDIEISDCDIECRESNYGGINISDTLHVGEELGYVGIYDNKITMFENGRGIQVHGKFHPYVQDNSIRASGITPTARSIFLGAGDGGSAGNGPVNAVCTGNSYDVGFAAPLIQNDTGVGVTRDNDPIG